jgi:hypothetical protein
MAWCWHHCHLGSWSRSSARVTAGHTPSQQALRLCDTHPRGASRACTGAGGALNRSRIAERSTAPQGRGSRQRCGSRCWSLDRAGQDVTPALTAAHPDRSPRRGQPRSIIAGPIAGAPFAPFENGAHHHQRLLPVGNRNVRHRAEGQGLIATEAVVQSPRINQVLFGSSGCRSPAARSSSRSAWRKIVLQFRHALPFPHSMHPVPPFSLLRRKLESGYINVRVRESGSRPSRNSG